MKEKLIRIILERSIPYLITQMNNAIKLNEIKQYEDRLIASLISSLCILAGIANLIVRWIWQDDLIEIIGLSLAFIFIGLLIDWITYNIQRNKLRAHALGVCMVAIEAMIVLAYYQRIGTVVWTAVFLLLMVSMIRLDRIIFSYIVISAIVLNNYLYYLNLDEIIVLNRLFYIAQINVFVVIFIVGMLWSKIYRDRYVKSHQQFVEMTQQKEEITGLYEEVLATEEELRSQNERLHEYNEAIKDNEKKLNYMAYYDSLTGLPNRKHVIEKLNFLIKLAESKHTKFAFVFVDLDGFKKINDTKGHPIGDKFLIEIGDRLKNAIDENDTVGRFGGDEFAIIVEYITHEEEVYGYIDRIRKAVNQDTFIDGVKIYASASFGISLYPLDAIKVMDLFKMADAAMYKAKHHGKNNIQFYEKEMKDEILGKIELEVELKEAFNNNEFYLLYQPQVAVGDSHHNGFEALIRWKSPKRGIVGPDEFISILEEMGLIIDVGNWVIEEACKKIIELNHLFEEEFYISVNISAYQIKMENFVSDVVSIIEKHHIDGEQLELEITESALIDDYIHVVEKMNTLKSYGMRIALDDFGTGYASLNYLNRLPLDVLKIDKAFIWDIERGNYGKKVIRSIIDIVHDMNITVVAEGVENDEQLEYLIQENCDHIQGFLISKPRDDDGVVEFINNKKSIVKGRL